MKRILTVLSMLALAAMLPAGCEDAHMSDGADANIGGKSGRSDYTTFTTEYDEGGMVMMVDDDSDDRMVVKCMHCGHQVKIKKADDGTWMLMDKSGSKAVELEPGIVKCPGCGKPLQIREDDDTLTLMVGPEYEMQVREEEDDEVENVKVGPEWGYWQKSR